MTGPLNPLADSDTPRVAVWGHPGHELALFGVLQRHPPDTIIVITDGGAQQRLEESQQGFRSIGLLDRVQYLGFPEHAFYAALLGADATFFRGVAAALRRALMPARPSVVFCDAVEFYNPVHDVTLPLVRAALGGAPVRVYEVPLVYEMTGEIERYRVQRIPESLSHRRVVFDLGPAEVDRKRRARDQIYRSLHEQAGPELLSVPDADLAREELAVAADPTPAPGTHGRALRYERRARLLHAEGRVARMITYRDHFVPMLQALGVGYEDDAGSIAGHAASQAPL